MIKTMIFDIGKVLIQFDWMKYMHSLYTDEEMITRLTDAIWNSGWWVELDRGAMPEKEILDHILDEAGDLRGEAEKIFDRFGECMGKQDYAIPWVKELKEMGYKVLFLSNYSDFLVRSYPEILDFIPYMDGGVFSYKVKLIKPNAEIFQKICEEYDLKPEECLFTDDVQHNVDAARAYGMKAFRFDGYDTAYPTIMNFLKAGGEGELLDLPKKEVNDGINWSGWNK